MATIFKKRSIWLQTIVLFDLRQWLTMSSYWHFIYTFDLYFFVLIKFFQPFWGAILNFMVKTVLKHKKYPSIRFLTSELARNYTSLVSTTHLSLYITVYVFSIWRWAYFWAAILDFKVKMVQHIVKSFYHISITFTMPELTGNYTSFAFFVQSAGDVTFSGFQYGVDSQFGLPSWIWKSKQTQNAMNINISDLQSQN